MQQHMRFIIVDKTKLIPELTGQIRGKSPVEFKNNKPVFHENNLNCTYEFSDQPGKKFTILKWSGDKGQPDVAGFTPGGRDTYSKILNYKEIREHINEFSVNKI